MHERKRKHGTMLQMTQVTKAYRTDLVETHALREFSLHGGRRASSSR